MKKHKDIIICSIFSLVIGLIVGITAGLFGQLLHHAESFRVNHYIYLLSFLGVIGVGILHLYKKVSPNSEQGLNLAIAYNAGMVNKSGKITKNSNNSKFPKAYGFLKLLTNFLMLLFGASTGKEGAFAAYGASMGDYVSRWFHCRRYRNTFLLCGVAAAVSGLFQTPLGGIFFALEFTAAGVMSYYALLPITFSSLTAFFFSRLCGFNAFAHNVEYICYIDVKNIILIIVCALVFGFIGRIFAFALNNLHKLYKQRIRNRYLCIFIVGTIMAIIFMLIHKGRYAGSGDSIMTLLFTNGDFKLYDFALKFIFTIICIVAGFAGGEMMPLLTIGATLGATMSVITGLPLELCAAMGCVAVYASATNTLIAPIFIGIEMFGTGVAVHIAVACIIAYSINGNRSVYTRQAHITPTIHEMLKKRK